MKNIYTIASVFMWLVGMLVMGLMFIGTGTDIVSTIGALAILNVLALAVVAFSR